MSDKSKTEMDHPVAVNDYLSGDRLTYQGWRRAIRDGVLLGQICGDCGHLTAAPKAACARCGARSLTARPLPTGGEVYAETTILVAPKAFDGPYQIALVTLEGENEREQGRVLVQIDGEVDIGDPVEFVGVVEAEGDPGPLFAPPA